MYIGFYWQKWKKIIDLVPNSSGPLLPRLPLNSRLLARGGGGGAILQAISENALLLASRRSHCCSLAQRVASANKPGSHYCSPVEGADVSH